MIKGLSDKRRLPRMGKIRLGIMVKSGEKTHPKEVDYFVCPPIVQKTYGPEPKELIVVFPMEDEEKFFQQFYMKYGNGVLQCKGDGEIGTYFDFDKMSFEEKKCPCDFLEKGKCKAVGRLQFMLPEVEEAAGVWQIDTSSKNSIIDINSGIEYIRGICGRISMIPIKLIRSETETHRMDKKEKKMKTGKHFTLKFSLEGVTIRALQTYGQMNPQTFFLPEPDPNQPDDLFPPNGFSGEGGETGEKETGDGVGEGENVPQTGPEGTEKLIFLTMSNGSRKKMTREGIMERFKMMRDSLVDEVYFGILGNQGFTDPKEIPDKDLNKIYGELIQSWKDSQ